MRQTGLKIGILGTRGIPNRYGGFEQFAEEFAVRMAARGHDMYVYTPHHHPYVLSEYKQVKLIRCKDPEPETGTTGQFVYDLRCILDSRKRAFDIILQLGYTSSTVWSHLFPKGSLLVTNMDGMEWKRSKYNWLTQLFLRQAERWGARHSDYLIADSPRIKDYLDKKYETSSTYIPYGAVVFCPPQQSEVNLEQLGLATDKYDLAIARFEPENNLEMILQSYTITPSRTLALVGNYRSTAFGCYCFRCFGDHVNIRFLDSIYDTELLNTLRYHAAIYLHGHSVGGTNPSLLEAMACSAVIVAHDNMFNRAVLDEDALFFDDARSLSEILSAVKDKTAYAPWIRNNLAKIRTHYNWDDITEKMEKNFSQWLSLRAKQR